MISGRMGDYAKLAVFIAVLLLSVSMMSVAINYLGDLSDVELEMEPQSEETDAVQSEKGEAAMGKGKTISAEGIPGGEVFPLFEIYDPPMTRYLRRLVGEVYSNGEWTEAEGHTPVPYRGGEIPLSITSTTTPTPVFFTVRPFFNISGYMPATLSVTRIEFDGDLERYPSLDLFSATEPFSTAYRVTYALYDFSDAELLSGDIVDMEEYLDVPEELEGRFKELAQGIVGSISNPYMRLRALESYLKDNFEYDREFTPSPPDVDPVEWFLFEEKMGLCSQFNSAFVLLARSIGIPARVVMGYIVKPDVDYQLVLPKQTHLWAEVPFDGLGWITFDATPQREEEEPTQIQRTPTITNITYNDEMALKGGQFIVQGTVTTFNGSAVDGLSVEVLLKVNKNETGVQCGLGTV
ncbi:MAG: transglutaminase family protein, partial [Candidatus Bathyarchaeia archaeon]